MSVPTDFETFDQHREWQQVLAAYVGQPSLPGHPWLPRIVDVGEVPAEQLSPIHGKLIALGYLDCEVLNAELGMGYQVTPLGRQALQRDRASSAAHEVEFDMAENTPAQAAPAKARSAAAA